jgi:hypothetical protein
MLPREEPLPLFGGYIRPFQPRVIYHSWLFAFADIMGHLTKLLVAGFCVLPAYAVDRVIPKNCTYGPNSRGCWRDGFDILSDYTNNSVIPPGKLVEVWAYSNITVILF